MASFLKKMLEQKVKKQAESDASLEKHSLLNSACYVLITCGAPSESGQMQVEMTYEGDKVLASYLLESALGQIENEP